MADRKIAYMERETLEALRTALAEGTCAAFAEGEDAEALAFLNDNAEYFDTVNIAADGTVTDRGKIIGNLSRPFVYEHA